MSGKKIKYEGKNAGRLLGRKALPSTSANAGGPTTTCSSAEESLGVNQIVSALTLEPASSSVVQPEPSPLSAKTALRARFQFRQTRFA